MIIEKLEIRGFGKLQNKVVHLKPGMNVIEGENESGKSTLHTFIRCMLFGAERSRGIGARTDIYTRYEPWENPAIYGGAMEFSCGGKRFRLERNFYQAARSVSLVCLEDGEHLSVDDGDLKMLLGGVNEGIFDNTVSIGQLRSVTGRELALELQNYLANYQSGADEEISPMEAVEILKEKRREFQRKKKEYQKEQQDAIAGIQTQITLLENEQENCGQKLDDAGQSVDKLKAESDRLESAIREEKQKHHEREQEDLGKTSDTARDIYMQWNRITAWCLGAALVCIITAIFLRKSAEGFFLGIIAAGVFLVACICLIIRRWLIRKSEREYDREGQEEVLRAPDLYQENSKDILSHKYADTIRQLQEAKGRRRQLQEEYKERAVRLYNLGQEISELLEVSYDPAPMDEEIAAIDMAIRVLTSTTAQIQQSVGSRLQSRMGEILRELTQGRYTSVRLNEAMEVEIQTIERTLKLHQLSRGTLEQVYLALRMASSEVLCREEELPVILDDVFPMYDDIRLSKALGWLGSHREQTILLTCHHREEEILSRQGVVHQVILAHRLQSG